MPRPDDGMNKAETARPDDGMQRAETARPDDGMQRAETARPDDGRNKAETARPDDGMQKAETALYGALDGAVALLGTVVFATTCLNVAGYGVVVEDGGLLFGTLPELRMRATLAGD